MSEIFSIDAVSNIIRDLLNDMGYRFYDMLFNEVAKKFRVFIDKEGGVTVADCKKTSTAISRALDESGIVPFSYALEVSSPGVRRPLKRPEHYCWAMGKFVEVNMEDGKMKGYLRDANQEGAVIATESGETFIPYASIVSARVMEELEYGKRR